MSKIITDKELFDIVDRAINKDEIDCSDSYEHFISDLGVLISTHFGGTYRNCGYLDDGQAFVSIDVDENVPDDGGVFKDYDTDVNWINGKETQR